MRRERSPALAVLAALGLLCLGRTATAEPPKGEKMLLGFEGDEIRRIAAAMGIPPPGKKPPYYMSLKEVDGGFDLRHHFMLGTWRVRPGKSSEGTMSLAVSASGYPFTDRVQRYRHVPPVRLPTAPLPYYQGMGVEGGYRLVFRTAGLFRTIFPADWSGYDLLRMDVWGEGVRQTFRIVLEDEEVEPPVVRNMAVEPGKWTTLEIDLQKATTARGLDLKRMAALYVIVSEGKPIRARLDNIRLCRKGTPAAFNVVRDDSPQILPASYRASPGPQPERVPDGRPDRSPIALGQPFVIPVHEEVARAPQAAGSVVKPGTAYLAVTPCGWAAAYDNQHLLVGFTGSGGRNVFAMQSLDGGKTWRGLDGSKRPTMVPVPNPDHGAGRGDIVGKRADVLLLTSLGCAGTCIPAMRQFAQKLTFTGTGWHLRPSPALVDCDGRHCGSNQTIIRSWQRSTDGAWSGPQTLARDESPLFWDRHKRPALVVQAYAPANFVPIAWSCKAADKDKGVIKFLRVPVTPARPSCPLCTSPTHPPQRRCRRTVSVAPLLPSVHRHSQDVDPVRPGHSVL